MHIRFHPWPWASFVLLLQACTSVPVTDTNLQGVLSLTQAHTQASIAKTASSESNPERQELVAKLLRETVTQDSAVQIALLNNPMAQAALLELDISQADLLQAGAWPNPGYSISFLRQGGEQSVEHGLHFNLSKVLFRDQLQDMASKRAQQTQRLVAAQLIQLAFETRKAHIQAIAAHQLTQQAEKFLLAAKTSADLAKSMFEAGNFNKLQWVREQTFLAEAQQNVMRTSKNETTSRARLARWMGLSASQMKFSLPDQLPDLPSQMLSMDHVQSSALDHRFDVQLAKMTTEHLSQNLAFTDATRYVNVLDLGVSQKNFNMAAKERGVQIGFELPIFDAGRARGSKAQAQYMQSVQLLSLVAINAQSEVEEAYANYQTAFAVAQHQKDVVLPLQQSMAEENMLRYNGMLIGVFDLLVDARAQVTGLSNYVDLLRDFWLSQVDLDMSLTGTTANLLTSIAH